MRRLLIGALCAAFAVAAVSALPAGAVSPSGHAAKKCKKSKKAAAAKKKKCKRKTVIPPSSGGSTSPTGPTGPTDTDADGVPDSSDNCVSVANSDQADTDADGKGNACDPCPASANPGSAGCPTTVYDINQGLAPPGSVRISGVVVSAVTTDGSRAWVEVPNDDPNSTLSIDYSAIEVDLSAISSAPSGGNQVTIDGTVSGTNGDRVLTASAVSVTGTHGIEYWPESPANFANSSNTSKFNGALVQLSSPVTVNSINGNGDWVLNQGFTVGHDIIDSGILPTCHAGDSISAIFGISDIIGGNLELLPRNTGDIAACVPALTDLTTDTDICVGTNNNAATVTLSSNVSLDTFIAVTSDDPSTITVPGGGVTVLNGQNSATFSLTGVAPGGPVTLTASLNGVDVTSQTSVNC